jgi:hypothetical protein
MHTIFKLAVPSAPILDQQFDGKGRLTISKCPETGNEVL